MVPVYVATVRPGNRFKRSCHGWRCRYLLRCARPLRSRNSATRLATLTPGRNSGPDRLMLTTIPSRGASKCQKCQGLHLVSRSGIGRDLHRLRACGHAIVGYNVAVGGDEEAGSFADDHTLRLFAVGKNLKDHQMRGATTALARTGAAQPNCHSLNV